MTPDEQQLAKARHEGVIDGLRRALEIAQKSLDARETEHQIRAEIERMEGVV